MRSDKANTNAKWTSTDEYKTGHARIFGYKPGQRIEAFIEGMGIVDAVVVSRSGERYVVRLDDTAQVEVSWDEIAIR